MKKIVDIELRKEVGIRLKKWVDDNFESTAEAGRVIGVHDNNLRSHYFSGKSAPGVELLLKLHKVECDIVWLLTGKTSSEREAALIKENEQLKAEIKKHHEYRNAMKVAEQILNYGKDPESKK